MKNSQIFKVVVEKTHKILSEINDELPTITPETYFSNLGASSCDRAQIAIEIVEYFNGDVMLEELLSADTVGEMVSVIQTTHANQPSYQMSGAHELSF